MSKAHFLAMRKWAEVALGPEWQKPFEGKKEEEFDFMKQELFFAYNAEPVAEDMEKAVKNPSFRPDIDMTNTKLRAQAFARECYLRGVFNDWIESLYYYDNGKKIKREAMADALCEVGILENRLARTE
jgi:hypothetical protein